MEAVAEATPLIASSSNQVCNGDALALLKPCYRTTGRYDKEQTLPLVLLEARWLAPFEHAASSCQSFDNTFLAVAIHCKEGIVRLTESLLFQIQVSEQNSLVVKENHITIFSSFLTHFPTYSHAFLVHASNWFTHLQPT